MRHVRTTTETAPQALTPSGRAFAVALLAATALGSAMALSACGGGSTSKAGGTVEQKAWPADDKSLCEWRGRADVDVTETAGPGAYRPNIRRVFHIVGDKDNKRLQLICREADTNLDGVKDVVRTFNLKGEPLQEKADSNYDGRLDVWIAMVNGRVAEMQEDSNFDGKVDVWKNYTDGVVSRVKRDRNFDGKPDLWEVYVRGKLERVGVDEDNDGAVDRWDRDLSVEQTVGGGGAAADAGAGAAAAAGGAKPDAGAGLAPMTDTNTADAGAAEKAAEKPEKAEKPAKGGKK